MGVDEDAAAMAAFAPPSSHPPLTTPHPGQRQAPIPPRSASAPDATTAATPPSHPAAASTFNANSNTADNTGNNDQGRRRPPHSLYDVVLDLPHPAASSSAAPARIFYPPSDGEGGAVVHVLPSAGLLAEFGPESGGGGQQQQHAGAAKIARFAFPEHDDAHNATEVAARLRRRQGEGRGGGERPDDCRDLNRHDGYLDEAYSPSGGGGAEWTVVKEGTVVKRGTVVTRDPPGNAAPGSPLLPLPSGHAFAHRLADGTAVHGHVRRYLPLLPGGRGRRDVGRRSARALVVLTRNAGGGRRMYDGVLKALEVLVLRGDVAEGGDDGSASEDGAGVSAGEGVRRFLRSLHQEHVNLCRVVAVALEQQRQQHQQQQQQGNRQQKIRVLDKPRIIALPLVELGPGRGLFGAVDVVKFAVPSPFLHGFDGSEGERATDTLSRNGILPALRCLGVVRAMRMLSALMSERRVIVTSGDAGRLSGACYGVAAMLAQGLIPPPSVFVPILPPGLVSLLQTPSSYLIGVLRGLTPNYLDLRKVSNIGEVVLFDLDSQQGNEPYFHGIADPQRSVPDLTRRDREDLDIMATATASRYNSIADVLYQDLAETLKMDKKVFWQGAVQEKLGLAAAKGKKVASAAVKKGLKYFKKKNSMGGDTERSARPGDGEGDADDEAMEFDDGVVSLNKLVGKGNYAYEQGFCNEETEVEARIAFTIFFVSLFGDLRTYLTLQTPGTSPVVDKPKFLRHRAANGETPGSAMHFLLGNFLSGKAFDAFVEARLEEVRMRRTVPENAPLFMIVSNHHRVNRIDFGLNHVRPSVRRIAADPHLPGNYSITWGRSVRGRVSEMTSAQAYNGDWRSALVQLTDDCRESSVILTDTMMVLWNRLQEGRGMQWKKSLLALQIFRNLLLNGPINAVAEGIDGFASIRILKWYTEALRAQNSKLVRDTANEVYSLVVDLPVLFARRRALVNQRRLANDPKPSPLRKETRMIKGINQFRNIHNALRPAGTAVAPAPTPVDDLLFREVPPAARAGVANIPASSAPQSGGYSNDLLSWGVASAPAPQAAASSSAGNYSNDLITVNFGAPPSPQVASTNNVGDGEQNRPTRQAPTPKAGLPPIAKDSHPANDLFALSFGASSSPQVTATNNTGGGQQKTPDPFSMQVMGQVMPEAGPPASNDPFSQLVHGQATSQTAPTTAAPFDMAGNPPAFASPPAPHQKQKQHQPQTRANGPNMAQPNQSQPQPPPMSNTTFSMASGSPVSPSHHTQQQSPMSLHPGANYQPQHQQQQQGWGTSFAQNGFQANWPMHPAQGNIAQAPVTAAGHPRMQQGVPFQQGTVSGAPPGVPPNVYGNVQKK